MKVQIILECDDNLTDEEIKRDLENEIGYCTYFYEVKDVTIIQ